MEFRDTVVPKSPDTYVSPLPAGKSFEFVSAHTIYPYESSYGGLVDGIARNIYKQQVFKIGGNDGNPIFENEYEIRFDSGHRKIYGTDEGCSILMEIGTYEVFYSYYFRDQNQDKYYTRTATYTFVVIENQLPLKKWTVTDVINRLLDVCEPIRQGEKPRFRLQGMNEDGSIQAGSQAAKFDTILSPEFSFTKQTLRECLQEIGRFIHGEPRLITKKDGDDYYFEVSFDLYGKTNRSGIYARRYVKDTVSEVVDSHASELDSNAENLINSLDKYSGVITDPFQNGFKRVRTENMYVRVTEENMLIETQYPIYTIEKLEYVDAFRELDNIILPIELPSSVDITPYVFEESEYNRLSSYGDEYPVSKLYALRYKKNGKNIDGLNFKRQRTSDISTAFGDYSIVAILKKVAPQFNISNYNLLAFRVTYTPIYNARISQSKAYYKEAGRAATLIFNQQSNLVESRYYGENLKGAIARIGNVEISKTYYLYRLGQIPKAGQMYNADYYISAVSVEFLPTVIKCTIGLSKDFNRLSRYIGINSEKRFSEISEKQASERNLLYREYVVIGDEESADEDSLIGDNLMAAIADTFRQEDSLTPITCVVAWGSSFQNNRCPCAQLTVVSSAFGNSISFSWRYSDNYSAGTTVNYHEEGSGSEKISGHFQNTYQYTDYYGRLYFYDFDLRPVGNNGILESNVGLDSVPTKSSGYFSTIGKTPYILRKDNRESLQVNVQIDFVTNRSNLIIGSALASYSPCIRGSDSSLSAKLYVFPEQLNKFIDHVKGSTDVTLSELPNAEISVSTVENGKFALSSGNFPASGKAWAIVTAQTEKTDDVETETGKITTQTVIKGGDVLIAQNMDVKAGDPFPTVYFTKKREVFDKTVWKDIR